jgi:hypothetical protein
MMRICLLAMIAVGFVATASSAFAGCGPHDKVVGACAAPAPCFAAPHAGCGLGPIDARRDHYIVDQGPDYEGPNVFTSAPRVYFESGFADEMPYPSVQFYTFGHGQHFYRAVRWHHWRHAQRSRSYWAYSTD